MISNMQAEKIDKKTVAEARRAGVMSAILAVISITLIICSFFVPPMGIIDGSVLAAVGELFGFAALFELSSAIKRGMDAKVTHRDTTIEVNSPDD